ncbi:hypothetical protein [Yoonia litorea]|uniref:Uncharacterized protein n=1 Tax=Yoonia litorea TaxID=1123755 RepID=A0A1I6M1E2_9RHOB|nr:hypothetical protein [Yoonia litorea]SFS09536.1 hypothetical protein SAMN05444714_1131 [Yoonia litorea]
MQVAPELQILILNAVILGVAYLGIYPTLQEKTLNKIMVIDLLLTGLALLVAGGWFMGTSVGFSLLLFEANWVVFTLVTLFVMEVPVFLWFAKKHGIPLDGGPDQHD